MSWIDKKYKEILGNREFPKSMKDEGWQKAQHLLDEEFPVPSSGSKAMPWRYGISILVVAAGLAGGLWWFAGMEDNKEREVSYYSPRSEMPKSNFKSSTQSEAPINNKEDVTAAEAPELTNKIHSNESETAKPWNESTNGESLTASNLVAAKSDYSMPSEDADKQNEGGNKAESVSGNSERNVEESLVPLEVKTLENTNLAVNEPISEPKEPMLDADFSEVKNEKTEEVALGGRESTTEKKTDEVVTQSMKPEKEKEQESTEFASGEEVRQLEQEKSESNEESKEEEEYLLSPEEKQAENAAEKISEKSASENTATANWHLAFPDVRLKEQDQALPLPSLSGKRFSISAWGAYTYVDKLLESDDEVYLAKRKAEEQAVWTTPTGISLDYFLNSYWTLSIGMGWSEYGEILDYDAKYIDTTYFDGRYRSPSSFNKVIALDSVRIIDSINVGHWNYTAIHEETDSAISNNNGRTNITYVEIPLTLGYRFGNGRVKPWIQSGISLGIPVHSSFRYVSASGRGLSGEESSASLAAFQWNYLLSLGLDCRITRHWSLRMNALGSLQLNSVLQSSPVSQRYYRLGGSLGVAYNF